MSYNRITVKKTNDGIIVTSNDDNIKQVFFGWASGAEFPEFYGRSIEKNVRYATQGHDEWQWDLTTELAEKMICNASATLAEHENFWKTDDIEPREEKANNDVLRALSDCLNGTQEELDEFTAAYITAALWITNDESTPAGGYPLEDNYGVMDISPGAMKNIKADCARFQEVNKALIKDDLEDAGHNFWLTRTGSGCSFLDWPMEGRSSKETAQSLFLSSNKFGNCWIEVGDDGQLHGF